MLSSAASDEQNHMNKKSDKCLSTITESDPCLLMENETNGANVHGSNNSLRKNEENLGNQCEQEEKVYYSGGCQYKLKTSQKINKKSCFLKKVENNRKKGCNWCENKTREKYGLTHSGYLIGLLLVCVIIILLLVIVILGLTWPRIPHSKQFPICTKPSCLKSSALILPNLDKTRSPCSDFYNFANGGLTARINSSQSDNSKWKLKEDIDFKYSVMIREAISVLPHQTRTSSLTWKIRNFYDSCMALDNIEADNERPLRKIIDELGGWNVLRNFQVLSWEFNNALVKLHEEYGLSPFFTISIIADPRDVTQNILQIFPSELGLPDKSYYYRRKEDKVLLSYCHYMRDVARTLGATTTDANSFSEDMFYFERRLAEITPSIEDLNDFRNHRIYNISTLKILAPSVPLYEILNALFHKGKIEDGTEILVPSNAYLRKISNIIATTDRTALNNYLIWKLAKKYLPYLSHNFQNLHSTYRAETMSSSKRVDRWEFCVKTLQKFMDFGLAAHLTSFFHMNESVHVVNDIFESIKHIVKDRVTAAQWIDLDLYKFLFNKLDGMTVQVGIPDIFRTPSYLESFYSKFYVQKSNFFRNILYGFSFLQEEKKKEFATPKKEFRWFPLAAAGDRVQYVASSNKIIVPQKLLIEPYYDPNYVPPVLYGRLGIEIAREMIAALFKFSSSENGLSLEELHRIADLSLASVEYQLKCLSDFLVTNHKVSLETANKTSLNAFLEISAVKQAAEALRKATVDLEHVHQAGLEDFDDEQIFFIVYAQTMFNGKKAEEVDEDIEGSSLESHKLLKIVEQQLKNFASAFDCEIPVNICKYIL